MTNSPKTHGQMVIFSKNIIDIYIFLKMPLGHLLPFPGHLLPAFASSNAAEKVTIQAGKMTKVASSQSPSLPRVSREDDHLALCAGNRGQLPRFDLKAVPSRRAEAVL
jgi:hypothetical protein